MSDESRISSTKNTIHCSLLFNLQEDFFFPSRSDSQEMKKTKQKSLHRIGQNKDNREDIQADLMFICEISFVVFKANERHN